MIRGGIIASARRRTPPVIYDSEAQAYFDVVAARGGTISATTKQKINDFIVYLRDLAPGGNSWQSLDRFFVFTNDSEIAALTSIKYPSSTIAEVINSPLHSTAGYGFDGSTQYIKSKYNMNVDKVNITSYLQVSCGGSWTNPNSNGQTDFPAILGATDGSSNTFYQVPRNQLYGGSCGLNYNGISRVVFGSNTAGHIVQAIRRYSNNNFEFTTGNSSERVDGGAGNNGAMTNAEIFIGAINNNGTTVNNFWPGNVIGVSDKTTVRLRTVYWGNDIVNGADMDYAIRTYLT